MLYLLKCSEFSDFHVQTYDFGGMLQSWHTQLRPHACKCAVSVFPVRVGANDGRLQAQEQQEQRRTLPMSHLNPECVSEENHIINVTSDETSSSFSVRKVLESPSSEVCLKYIFKCHVKKTLHVLNHVFVLCTRGKTSQTGVYSFYKWLLNVFPSELFIYRSCKSNFLVMESHGKVREFYIWLDLTLVL